MMSLADRLLLQGNRVQQGSAPRPPPRVRACVSRMACAHPPQYFQRVIPHQFDSCPDKLVLKAYQVKYNPKKMKRSVPGGQGAGRTGSPRVGW